MIYTNSARVNRVDVEDRLVFEKQAFEPNATYVYTPNVGVIEIDSIDLFEPLAIQEFEAILTVLFKKDVKLIIAD